MTVGTGENRNNIFILSFISLIVLIFFFDLYQAANEASD